MEKHQEILNFWFGNIEAKSSPEKDKEKLWFTKSEETDQKIKELFTNSLENFNSEKFDEVLNSAEKSFATIILLDQFSRNIYRNNAKSFEKDALCLKLTTKSIEFGYDKEFHPTKRIFFYLPLEHTEDLKIQEQCVSIFEALLTEVDESLKGKMLFFKDYAIKHLEIIKRFGRFPHRNIILGRESTLEEIEFLKQPNSSF